MYASRPAAAAGSYYPEDSAQLGAHVARLLNAGDPDRIQVQQNDPLPSIQPAALVVPHGSYRFSGAIAASAYRQLIAWRSDIRRVILLGPPHRSELKGAALSSAGYFKTPLGEVVLDTHEIASLEALQGFEYQDEAHAREHTLEVQLPLLQSVLERFRLIPILVGEATPQLLRPMLERYWGAEHTLIVVTTDLSHHLTAAQASGLDRQTCEAIEELDEDHVGEQQACGRYPLRALLKLARHHHADVRTLAMGTSADAGDDPQRVVGYGAWAFYP